MNSARYFSLVQPELKRIEEELYKAIDTDQPLMKEASEHLIKAGGKRVRPAFLLLSGSIFRDDLEALIPMATAVELVHTATLVHDDVIDNSPSRRGQPTVKAVYGNRLSVYSGNYLLARSLALASVYGRDDVIALLARASVRICEGEIIQMRTCFDINQDIKDYFNRIERKTAILMSLSCELGALLSGASPNMVRYLRVFGRYMGMAFQITDDILDFIADEAVLGKPTGSDLRQGIITLPALYALRCSPARKELAQILSDPEKVVARVGEVLDLIKDCGGIEYSQRIAEWFINKAVQRLSKLPDKKAREALEELAYYFCSRDF